MRSRWFLLACLIVAGLMAGWYFGSADTGSSPAAGNAATPAPGPAEAPLPDWPKPASDEARQASQVRTAADLRSALEAARRALPVDAPQLHALAEEVRVSCSVARRPDASSRRVDDDPNREPWISELMRRCAGLLDSDLDPPPDYGPQTAQRNAELPDWVEAFVSQQAALEISWRHLHGTADASLLAAALRFLLEHDALPMSRIFAGTVVPARADIDNALIPAADWIACSRSASCGSQGIWTLYTCAQFGCPPGADLPLALYRLLPPQQFEIAQRIVRWAQRGAPG
ncbi:MAG: hypothetical protein AB7E72_15280 [Lysobacterales bacterium]